MTKQNRIHKELCYIQQMCKKVKRHNQRVESKLKDSK